MSEKKHDKPVSEQKKAVVAALKEQLTSSKSVVLTGYRGLTVAMDTKLRRALREAGVEYRVVKNTLAAIAAKEAGLDDLIPSLADTTAMAISKDDAVAPAKVIADFIKKNKLFDEKKGIDILHIKAGIVDGAVINAAEVNALASLPSREVLLAKLLGSMKSPISGTVGVLSGVIRNAVYVLEAVRQKKEKEQGAA